MDRYNSGLTYQTTDNAFKSCTAAFTQKVHLIQAQYSYLARQAMPEWGSQPTVSQEAGGMRWAVCTLLIVRRACERVELLWRCHKQLRTLDLGRQLARCGHRVSVARGLCHLQAKPFVSPCPAR